MSAVLEPLIDPDDAVILFADLQAGIADLPLTVQYDELIRSVAALAKLSKIFGIPSIISTVPDGNGSQARVIPTLIEQLAPSRIYQRTTPNTFDNGDLRDAIAKTGRRTLLVSGVSTEVAVGLPCLWAAANGFDVYAVLDACGGVNERSEAAVLRRFSQEGVRTTSVPALCGELAGDFSKPNGMAAINVLFEMAKD